jgi:anti-anti-sigma factor
VHERRTGASVDGSVSVQRHRAHQDLVLVQVRGDVGDAAAADLGRRLTAVAARGTDAQVVLDLAGVTALSRAGLDAVLWAQKSLEAGGGSLELLEPSAPVVLLLHDAAAAEDEARPQRRVTAAGAPAPSATGAARPRGPRPAAGPCAG